MDDPNADPRMLARTYERFGLVNAFVSGWRSIYVRSIRPRLRRDGGGRLLDVGTGAADLPRAMLRWARRDGLALEVVAIDPDERAFAWASARPEVPGLTVRAAHTRDLLASGERFDIVISNHVLHHLTDAEVIELLADSTALAGSTGIVIHGDIARSRFAYVAFAAVTWPFASTLFRDSFIREDGLTSIRRSRTVEELAALIPAGWVVVGGFPSRLEVRSHAARA